MTAHLSHPKYRPDIDGLRAIAVLSVVAFHAFPSWVKGGFIGVDVFFVISGYLISTIIFENLDKGTFSFKEFYSRRIRRIFPALLLVLAVSYVLGWFTLLADEYKQLGKHIAGGAGFVSNVLLWKESGYFDNAAETKPLLHLWSLGVEEQFYIVYPLLIWFAWKRQFNLLTVTTTLAIISMYLNLKGIKHDAVATFYSPQTRFWELMCGSSLAWVTLYKKEAFDGLKVALDKWLSIVIYREPRKFDGTALANFAAFMGFLLLAYGFFRINKGLSFPGKWALVPVLGSILIIAAGQQAWVNRKILSNRVAVWFGLISFPLYLWHWVLLSFARIVESETPTRNIRIVCILLSICFAWVTYKFVEYPIRIGNSRKLKTIILSALLIIIGLIGMRTYYEEGYEFRDSIKGFVNNKNELVRTPAINDECLAYTGYKSPLFPYCKFTNVGALETVAVIGDSHAHVAYPGIADFLKGKGINTVLLANSGCPPFLNEPIGGDNAESQKACDDRIKQLLDVVKNKKDIKKVFLFTRGPTYITGTEPSTGDKVLIENTVSYLNYGNGLQRTIDELNKAEKSVFYITENPELSYSAESCIVRPYRISARDCRPVKNNVLSRQKNYLEVVSTLRNVTLINSINAFCPDDKCLTHHDGKLLYADDDHLSVAGSNFQVEKLIREYFQ